MKKSTTIKIINLDFVIYLYLTQSHTSFLSLGVGMEKKYYDQNRKKERDYYIVLNAIESHMRFTEFKTFDDNFSFLEHPESINWQFFSEEYGVFRKTIGDEIFVGIHHTYFKPNEPEHVFIKHSDLIYLYYKWCKAYHDYVFNHWKGGDITTDYFQNFKNMQFPKLERLYNEYLNKGLIDEKVGVEKIYSTQEIEEMTGEKFVNYKD